MARLYQHPQTAALPASAHTLLSTQAAERSLPLGTSETLPLAEYKQVSLGKLLMLLF